MNLSDAIEFTFQYRPAWISGKSIQTNRINCAHALRLLGDVDVATIKPMHFTKLQQDLVAEGKSNGTTNRVCAAVHTVLTELHLNDLLPVVPTYRRLKEPPSQRGYFSRDEIQKLLDNAPRVKPHGSLLRDSIEFSVTLGVRQGEMLGLRWPNIDLDNQSITLLDTKNGTDHILPIPDALMPMLERRYQERFDDVVFPWRDKEELLIRFKALKKLCGLPNDTRVWHSLRHTCGTWMVEAGVPIRSVMSVLNHKNIETTLRYAKGTTDAKSAALSAINL